MNYRKIRNSKMEENLRSKDLKGRYIEETVGILD
jgi:hypothetical protein